MGPCVSKNHSSSFNLNRQSTDSTLHQDNSYLSHPSSAPSSCTAKTKMPPTECTSKPRTSFNALEEQTNTRQNVDPEDWTEERNSTPSVIIRRSKKSTESESKEGSLRSSVKSNREVRSNREGCLSPTLDSNLLRVLQESEVLSGEQCMRESYSSIVMRGEQMDLEFLLPRCGAGPLVVPLINYERYQV